MVDRVAPNTGGVARAALTAGAMAYGSGVRSSGWIVPHGTDYFADAAGLNGTPLNGFSDSVSGTSLTATINAGEGFVGGYWFGRDTATEVTLASNTAGQTVYAGVDVDTTDGVIVGLDAAFGPDDPQVPLYDYTTDASGILAASTVDRRTHQPPEAPVTRWTTVAEVTDTSPGDDLSLDTGTFGDTFSMYRCWIRMEDEAGGGAGTETYARMQVNGRTATAYNYDYFDAFNNTYVSSGGDNKFNRICGTNGDGTWGETRVTLHQPGTGQFYTTSPGDMDSTIKASMEMRGLEHNVDHFHYGELNGASAPINRINVFTAGPNATGAMVVEGTDFLATL